MSTTDDGLLLSLLGKLAAACADPDDSGSFFETWADERGHRWRFHLNVRSDGPTEEELDAFLRLAEATGSPSS